MGLVLTEILSFLKTREKPQGGGAFFWASLIWKSKKKPHPFWILWFSTEIPYIGIIEKCGGAFFWASLIKKTKKKPHPPGAFREFPLYAFRCEYNLQEHLSSAADLDRVRPDSSQL